MIGDLGLCQKLVDKKDDQNEIFGVVPYIAPEVLSGKPHTQRSDIYSFGMIMWEYATGKKPFYNRSHNHGLIPDVLEGKRPEISKDTPEFYIDLMKNAGFQSQKIDLLPRKFMNVLVDTTLCLERLVNLKRKSSN